MTIWKDYSEKELFNDNTEPYQNVFYLCTSCFKIFRNQKRCEGHYMSKCNIPPGYIEHVLTEKESMRIVRANDSSNLRETNDFFTKASYNIAYVSRKELGKEFNFIGKQIAFNERVYLVLDKHSEIKGYVLFRNKRDKWYLENIYIIPSYRRKGYASFLLETALKDIREKLENVIFSSPLSPSFEMFLESKGLKEVKVRL